MTNISKAPLIFMPVLLYPPVMFTGQISPSIRISLFTLLVMYLFLATQYISKKDMQVFFLVLILLVSNLIVNFASPDSLRTAGNTLLTLAFAWALSRSVNSNKQIKENLVRFYTNLFTLIPICSILSVIFLFVFGELNLFNIDAGGHETYLFTPFGAILTKDFFGIAVVYRSFSFFDEPVYLASFCAANIFLVAPCLKERSNIFLIANVIGGILTFSYLFFVLSFLLFFSKKIPALTFKSGLYLLLLVGSIIFLSQVDLFLSSSFSDRIDRINLFFAAMEDANLLQVVFGRGFMQDTGFDRGFSAGLFTTIYEMGILGLVAILFFVNVLSNKKRYIFLLFFVSLLVFEPIKLPLFWMLVVVLSVLLPAKNQFEQPHGAI